MSDDTLVPKDHAEEVALFRAGVIGTLVHRDFTHGGLRAAVAELTRQAFRPPGAVRTHHFGRSTLERWYYAFRTGGLDALRPHPRADRGRARQLNDAQRTLLLDIRREHPDATASVIVRTLIADGRLAHDAVSPATVRRLFTQHGLDRVAARDSKGARTRLRWQAERPGALWHGDVCHGPTLTVACQRVPVRIHGLLDDASRFLPALEAHTTEREVDMLGVLVRALRRHGPPVTLYLDNGSTYRGDALRLACARLGITLVHARPYNPEARGKMERFWRTLREGCLDHLGPHVTLADVSARITAFVTEHYHRAPHAALMGRAPATVWNSVPREADTLDEAALRTALTSRARRRVRKDTTLSVAGIDWECDQGFLAGRTVVVARCMLDPGEAPWIEHEGHRYLLRPVDARANATRRRPPRRGHAPVLSPPQPTPFDPAGALLARAALRDPDSTVPVDATVEGVEAHDAWLDLEVT